MGARVRINYFTIVWGQEYIKKFLLYTLPSIMSTENIECLRGHKYYIYTDSGALFYQYPAFNKLKEVCEVVFLNLTGSDRDTRLIQSANDAVKRAFDDKAILKLIPPETVFSKTALPNLLVKIVEGYDAVIFPFGGLRVNENSYINNPCKDNLVFSFLLNMHKETKAHYISSKTFFPTPVMKIDKKNKVNSFYHQPSYMNINKIGTFKNLELDFVNSLVDVEKVYAVKNSDEAFQISLTPDKYSAWADNIYNEKDFMDFNSENINPVSNLSFEQGFAIL